MNVWNYKPILKRRNVKCYQAMVTLSLGMEGRITIKWFFRKWDGDKRTGLIWLRIGTDGGHLRMWQWTFGYH